MDASGRCELLKWPGEGKEKIGNQHVDCVTEDIVPEVCGQEPWTDDESENKIEKTSGGRSWEGENLFGKTNMQTRECKSILLVREYEQRGRERNKKIEERKKLKVKSE